MSASPPPAIRTNSASLPLSPKQYRQLILAREQLTAAPSGPVDQARLTETIARLKLVQVDSIQWVERAHHMILHSRLNRYRPKMLARALEQDRTLFENWTHDASVLPVAHYRYWQRHFIRFAPKLDARYANWHGGEFRQLTDNVLNHIAKHGASRGKDLSEGPTAKSGAWWEWNGAKTALEYLWRTGQLAISGRQNFQKIYDLTERVIPGAVRADPASEEELIDWCCRTALSHLGVATASEIAKFFDLISRTEVLDWIARQPAGTLIDVSADGQTGQKAKPMLAFAELENELEAPEKPRGSISILNPFDPVLRNRDRLARAFGFDYRIEIFVPEPQREYGYYIFPLLKGDRLIGRIDLKANRKTQELELRKVWWEQPRFDTAANRAGLDRAVEKVSRLVF